MDFQSEKSFGKLRLRPFQPYHPLLCMSKHVEGVESQNNFRHALTYIAVDGMVGKVLVSAFQNFFRIENLLNIKKVMSKTVKASFDLFDMSNMSNN